MSSCVVGGILVQSSSLEYKTLEIILDFERSIFIRDSKCWTIFHIQQQSRTKILLKMEHL